MGRGGKSQQNSKNKSETPKRDRSEEEEELSPSVIQERKQQKMGVSDKDFRDLSERVDKILAKLVEVDEKLVTLEEIKASQQSLKISVSAIEKRVDEVEKKCHAIRESEENEKLKAELEELRKKTLKFEQESSCELIVRNLPLTVLDNRQQLNSIIDKLFGIIDVQIDNQCIQIAAAKANDKKSAMATLTFDSAQMKARVLGNFREKRKNFKQDCLFLVHKFIQLQAGDHLNAKEITISNKLTPHYARLISYAREFASHFEFIYDTPKGAILLRKNGRFEPVVTTEDVHRLIGEVQRDKKEKKRNDMPRERVPTRSSQASTSNGIK
jgi:hypothetical protein